MVWVPLGLDLSPLVRLEPVVGSENEGTAGVVV